MFLLLFAKEIKNKKKFYSEMLFKNKNNVGTCINMQLYTYIQMGRSKIMPSVFLYLSMKSEAAVSSMAAAAETSRQQSNLHCYI